MAPKDHGAMPTCLFDRASGRYLSGAMHDSLLTDPTTQVQLVLAQYPDPRTQRWDGTTGVRAATAAEMAAYDALTPKGRDFAVFLVQQLDLAPTRADRFKALSYTAAATVAAVNAASAFASILNILNVNTVLGAFELTLVRKFYADAAFSAAERTRIEAGAGAYGVTLP